MAKYENMYIMIWPEDKFVLKRTIKVKGRIRLLKTSTNGKKIIKAVGVP
jgi:hypothetical protein